MYGDPVSEYDIESIMKFKNVYPPRRFPDWPKIIAPAILLACLLVGIFLGALVHTGKNLVESVHYSKPLTLSKWCEN